MGSARSCCHIRSSASTGINQFAFLEGVKSVLIGSNTGGLNQWFIIPIETQPAEILNYQFFGIGLNPRRINVLNPQSD
jgi:ABC-type uncharacterized transport system permease subunit